MTTRWRPEEWEKNKIAAFTSREHSFHYDLGYEDGADAMLEALFKLAKESPTGTFTIDSKVTNIFNGELNG